MLSSIALAQSFTVQNSTSTENLRGLSAVSSSVIWASGTHGTYLRTLDGGTTWTAGHVVGAEALDFRDVQAFSADEAYLLAAGPGEQSRIYRTADAGKTWALQFTNTEPKGFYDCMGFWDRTHGIALGDPVDGEFELITTEDGEHWLRKAHSPRAARAWSPRTRTTCGSSREDLPRGCFVPAIAGTHGRLRMCPW
jgi:photosystem II stability/assembly factor-like uncharacterized protein